VLDSAPKEAYSRQDVRRMLGVSEQLLRTWERHGLIHEVATFSFSDIIALKALQKLRENRIPPRKIGRALTALDRSPNRDWTVGSLAREVGLSRSVLAERFTQFVGQPAMQYLTNWRMQLAANHLLSGADSIATVADRVGYESEAAFSRAFKKWSECLQASGGGAAVIDAARSGRGLCYWPPALPSRSAEGRYSCETLTR